MNLLLVTQDLPPRPGGMARYYDAWAHGLGPQCTLASGTWRGTEPAPGVTCRRITFPFELTASHRTWNLYRANRQLEKAIQENKPDVLLSGNIRPFGPLVLRLARRHRIPAVQVYHGNDLLRTARRWKRHLMKRRRWERVVRETRLHVVNSAFTLGLAQNLGLPGDRVAVVPPEVDTQRFRPPRDPEERRRLRQQFGWDDDQVITLFVGRTVARKGINQLVNALTDLPANVRLVATGDDTLTGPRDPGRTRTASTRVQFLGHVPHSDLPLLYRAADVFAGPSRERREKDDVEGFGIVFLEAAASGLPILATRTGGIPEAVEDGVGGLLIPPEDAEALTRAWNRLALDATLRDALGRGGRAGRATKFGPGSSARCLVAAVKSFGLL